MGRSISLMMGLEPMLVLWWVVGFRRAMKDRNQLIAIALALAIVKRPRFIARALKRITGKSSCDDCTMNGNASGSSAYMQAVFPDSLMSLEAADPEVFDIIEQEKVRQW